MIFEVHILANCRVSVISKFEAEAKTQQEAIKQSDKWFPGHWVRVNVKGSYKFIYFKMLADRKLERIF